MILRPVIFSNFKNILAVQTKRLGGVSEVPYDSLNLGSMTQDNPSHVERNKEIICGALGINTNQIVRSRQVHGNEILKANKGGYFDGYDALVTDKNDLFLAVSTADCTPILLYDKVNKAVAAIHAGWKGTKNYLVAETIHFMQKEYSTMPANLAAYIGPCIAECSFEVDADVAQYFDGLYSRFDSQKGKYFINLKQHNKDQMTRMGVLEANIEVSEYDTYESTDLFFSHRKEKGITGRMWSGIAMVNE